MSRITVSLEDSERDALIQLAKQEYRDPRAQAALLIRRALETAGLLPAEEETTSNTATQTHGEARHANA